ncbi:MAG: beta-N-acetylglucosaminidase domain-containing protein [Planctomycetota bacterium]|nr:beta-N-acetylglucosaminidase domain-containing protein [Planctomycetota bacterium]
MVSQFLRRDPVRLIPQSLLIGLIAFSGPAISASFKDIVQEYIGDGLELAITPTPQQSKFSDEMFEIGPVQIIMPPGEYGAPTTIQTQAKTLFDGSLGKTPFRILVGNSNRNPETRKVIGKLQFPSGVEKYGEEAYQLYAGKDPSEPDSSLIILAGNSPAGDFWALQSLAQVVAEKNGIKYVRGAAIADWPMFPKRGNKRPRVWEHRFKANYMWVYRSDKKFVDVFRTKGAWVYAPKAIDLADPEWQPTIVTSAKQAFENGIREFVVKYDDTPRSMTPATGEMFGGNYFAAQVKFLTSMFNTIKSWDERCDVFFMPQPYWTNAFDLQEYGDGLKKAGGLPPGMGLSFCGQEVISTKIPLECVTKAQEVLGLTGHKAQIYDNYPRGGDFSAYQDRDPDLWNTVECIFPERGTPISRATVYDYLWNPGAYDPERSLKLACREFAGRRPDAYRALYDYVTTWNRERNAAAFMSNADAGKQLPASARMLREKYEALEKIMKPESVEGENRSLATESGLLTSFLHGENWGESAALDEREKYNPLMIRHGYREARARRRTGPIAIDGSLDEQAWNAAEVMTDFSYFRQLGPTEKNANPAAPVAAADEQSEVRVLYDDEYLFVGALLKYAKPPQLPNWGKEHKAGDRALYAWRVPGMEICIDPERDRDSYFQIMPNLQGWFCELHYAGFGSKQGAGGWWHSGLDFKAAVGETSGVLEIRIPLKSLGDLPKPGDRWGMQLCRNLNGASTWSYMFEFFGFRYPMHFGTLIFE